MTSRALVPKISLSDLAQRWGWPPQRLYRMCAKGSIPHLVINRRIYFEQDALDRWLQSQRRETATATRERNRLEECSRLGISEVHEFS